MPFQLLQITAAYSNAMLVAIMPHVSDFAKKLDLPTSQPITIAQVRRFNCFPRSDHIGGRVILTNGCAFVFDHGRVENFESPGSYFYLQNPDLIPRFYGPIKLTEGQALQVAHKAIKKLGYTDSMLSADRRPQTTPPERDGSNYIARYRFRWMDTTRGHDPKNPPLSIEFEVNATTGQIQMLRISNPNTYRPDIKLDVQPKVVGNGPETMPAGPGRKVTPVSPAYAKAFLAATLPQLSDYAKRINLLVKVPISAEDVNMAQYLTKYNCGIVEGDPRAFIDMKSGDHYIYSHGQVVAFYASDAMNFPGRERPNTYAEYELEQAKFLGQINMTTNEAVNLVRQSIRKLGYSEKMLHVDEPPQINGPNWWGTNRIARCFIFWSEFSDGPTWVNSEVDMAAKRITSLYVNDHTITNIWRKPPKIEIPIGGEQSP